MLFRKSDICPFYRRKNLKIKTEKTVSPIRISANERYTLLTKVCKTGRNGRCLTYDAVNNRAGHTCFSQVQNDRLHHCQIQ